MKKLTFIVLVLLSCSEPEIMTTQDQPSGELNYRSLAPMSIISGCMEVDTIITDNNALKNPHDAIIDGQYAYISGKGHPNSTLYDGSFAVFNLATKQIEGSYYGYGDQLDGETVLQLSANRVLHFVKNQVILFDVSDKSNPLNIRVVSHTDGVGNGAIQIGSRVYSANKGGFIDVFDVSDIDNFYLLGRWGGPFNADLKQWHDVDVYGDYIITVKRNGTVARIKVRDNGIDLPIQDWTVTAKQFVQLKDANRVRVQGDFAIVHSGSKVSKVSISGTLTYISQFVNGTFSAGADIWNGLVVAPYGVGIRLLDFSTNPPTEVCNFYDDENFLIGTNSNFHDSPVYTVNGENFILVTVQNDDQLAIVKIN